MMAILMIVEFANEEQQRIAQLIAFLHLGLKRVRENLRVRTRRCTLYCRVAIGDKKSI
ncbi:MAG: hypothetical protein II980_05570 [Clostridia bacterium]|nr:hypothetical protein [Clostridia bacterium]